MRTEVWSNDKTAHEWESIGCLNASVSVYKVVGRNFASGVARLSAFVYPLARYSLNLYPRECPRSLIHPPNSSLEIDPGKTNRSLSSVFLSFSWVCIYDVIMTFYSSRIRFYNFMHVFNNSLHVCYACLMLLLCIPICCLTISYRSPWHVIIA